MKDEKIEPILKWIFLGIIFFTVDLFIAEYFFPNDGQIFQVLSGLLTGFGGGFLTKIKSPAPEKSLTETTVEADKIQTTVMKE